MPRFQPDRRLLLATALLLLAFPAGADWLVPLEGDPIETRGPWTVDGETLTYTDTEGEKRWYAVAEIDLEASRQATAAKSDPDVVLYMTSWCGYCRKTSQLLKSLDVDFVAKDIERDRAAALEYRRKAGGYRGIPVLDFEGKIIRGYQAEVIHKLATQRKQDEAAGD